MNRLILILLMLAASLPQAQSAGPRGGTGITRGLGPRDPFFEQPLLNRVQMDYLWVWRGIKSDTEALRTTIGATNPEAATLLTEIQTNALFLEGKWDAWFKTHRLPQTYSASDPYLVALQRDNRLLGKLRKEKDEQKLLSVLRDVALDLQIKADNCRHSGDGLGKEIKVKVHTKSDGKEVPGFEVFYVQKGMFDVKSAHDRFPRQSSPTDDKVLCPGAYFLWARKKGFTGDPVPMRIGGRGETGLELDLDVPIP